MAKHFAETIIDKTVVNTTNAKDNTVRYTIATLVTDQAQHEAMSASFRKGGFDGPDCEYLVIDNTSKHQTCAYRGLNAALHRAQGRFVILCHQDVRLIEDGRAHLDAQLAALDQLDPDWAIAGNAGGVAPGQLALRISDPHGNDRTVGNLPARVASVDENFIVVRREARIGFSRDLTGFHFYGADICLNADLMGWHAYVIDFHIRHLSPGNKDDSFAVAEAAFRAKWSNALRPRWLQTTCSLLRLSGATIDRLVAGPPEKIYAKILRRLPGASGWTPPRGGGQDRLNT